MDMNRLAVVNNPYQGKYKKVLCVCSAGCLRSPTAALVLSQEPFNFNTRCAGINDGIAIIKVDDVLLAWADEIVCMDEYQQSRIHLYLAEFKWSLPAKLIINLNIGDIYSYRDPELMKLIKEKYEKATKKD